MRERYVEGHESPGPPPGRIHRRAAQDSEPEIHTKLESRTTAKDGGVDATPDCNLSVGPTNTTNSAPAGESFHREHHSKRTTSQRRSLGAWHAGNSMIWRLPSLNSPRSPVMARAVVWPSPSSSGVGSRISWKGEVSCSKQKFFSRTCNLRVKSILPPTRSPSEGSSASIRSSLDESAANSSSGRYASGCGFDMPCALSCPVNRDTYVQGWLEESVHEIVRNIQEAPFLQYVFDAKTRSHRQKIPQDLLKNPHHWTQSPLRHSLSQVDPDGIILVQKLDPSCTSTACIAESFDQSGDVCALQGEGGGTDVWGVLVQARGVNGNACYLLETTRVLSSGGVCTRYCLTRAKCFGPSYGHQLQDSWLL